MEKIKEGVEEKKIKELLRKEKILKEASKILRVEDKDLPRVIERFLNEIKKFEEKLNKS